MVKFSEMPSFIVTGSTGIDVFFQDVPDEIEYLKTKGLELNPDFQRGHVWNINQQQAFCEYALKGGKSGKYIYLNCYKWSNGSNGTPDNPFVCVDGLQRLTAIMDFYKDKFKVFGHYASEFEDVPRGYLTNMYFVINELQYKREVLQWYIEMNSGGTPHTESEINKVKEILNNEY